MREIPYVGDAVLMSRDAMILYDLKSPEAFLVSYNGTVSGYQREFLANSRNWEIQVYVPREDVVLTLITRNIELDKSRQAENVIQYRIDHSYKKYALASKFPDVYLEQSINRNKKVTVENVFDKYYREDLHARQLSFYA